MALDFKSPICIYVDHQPTRKESKKNQEEIKNGDGFGFEFVFIMNDSCKPPSNHLLLFQYFSDGI